MYCLLRAKPLTIIGTTKMLINILILTVYRFVKNICYEIENSKNNNII